jgi:hypothetical protein
MTPAGWGISRKGKERRGKGEQVQKQRKEEAQRKALPGVVVVVVQRVKCSQKQTNMRGAASGGANTGSRYCVHVALGPSRRLAHITSVATATATPITTFAPLYTNCIYHYTSACHPRVQILDEHHGITT